MARSSLLLSSSIRPAAGLVSLYGMLQFANTHGRVVSAAVVTGTCGSADGLHRCHRSQCRRAASRICQAPSNQPDRIEYEYFARALACPHFCNKISKDYDHLYVISILSCSSMNFLWWSKYACIYIKFTLKQLCTMALKVVSMFLERVRCTSAYLFSSLTCTTKN